MPRSYVYKQAGQSTVWGVNYDYPRVWSPERDTYIPIRVGPVGESVISQGPTVVLDETRSFFGTNVPNWKQFQKANGYLPTTPCRDTKWTAKSEPINRIMTLTDSLGTYVAQRQERNGILDGAAFSFDWDWDSSLTDEAWSKLRQRLLDQDFNAPVFLAEAGKTLEMITDRARRVTRALSALRRGRINEIRQALAISRKKRLPSNLEGKTPRDVLGLSSKEMHNTWLELQYGWKPLLNDIHGAAKTLAELSFKRDQSTLTGYARRERKLLASGTGYEPAGLLVSEAKVWVTVRVKERSTKTLNSLGFLNPLQIAWELVPFSFVADWFVNIGDCIAEATAFAGVTVLDGGFSECLTFTGVMIEANHSGWDKPLLNSYMYRNYRRTPGVQYMPRLRVKSDPLSITKVITSAALIRQQVSRLQNR